MSRYSMYRLWSKCCAVILLLTAGGAVSAFEVPCWAFCTEQTSLQQDYIVVRDECREYAQLKSEDSITSPAPLDSKEVAGKRGEIFATCMADRGWGSGSAPTKVAAAPAPTPAPAPAPIVNLQALAPAAGGNPTNDKVLSRTAECAYARHAAAYTSNMAARAKACDLECAQASRAGKKAAACPQKPDASDF